MHDTMDDEQTNKKPAETQAEEKQKLVRAHDEAENDIQSDADLSNQPELGDDLDEGELANLEGEK